MRSNQIPDRIVIGTFARLVPVLLAISTLLFQTNPAGAAEPTATGGDASRVAEVDPMPVEVAPPVGAPTPAAPAPEAAIEPVSRTPFQLMRQEMEEIAQAGRERVAALGEVIAQTEDLTARLELHREVERAKLVTEIQLFQAQIRFADLRGKTELAATLRETVAAVAARNEIDLDELAPSEPKNTSEPAQQ